MTHSPKLHENARLALDTIMLRPIRGIPSFMPWENVRTYVEGIQYYREHGRGT